jgi:hypothetical protein
MAILPALEKWPEKERGTANTAGFGWRGGSGV